MVAAFPLNSSRSSSTSASTPVFAAMVSLVNSARLRKGFGPIGWLNPLLYKYADEFTNDVTVGNNYCAASNHTTIVCCKQGFEATVGWDPVTGVGSVNAGKMVNFLILNQFNGTNPADFLFEHKRYDDDDDKGEDDNDENDDEEDEDIEDDDYEEKNENIIIKGKTSMQ